MAMVIFIVMVIVTVMVMIISIVIVTVMVALQVACSLCKIVCEYGFHFTVFGSGLPFIDDQCPLLKVLGFKPSTNHVAIFPPPTAGMERLRALRRPPKRTHPPHE